jgi:uncharacterized protein YpmS
VKLTALGALVLIALSLGAATIVIVVNNFKQVNEEEHLPIFLEAQREAANTRGNIVEIIISLGFLAFIIVLIAVVYSRDRKKMLEEAKKAGSKRFQSAAATSDMDQEAEEAPAKAKDGEFDLDL